MKNLGPQILELIKNGPVLVSHIANKFPDCWNGRNIIGLYQLIWELELAGELVCLDFHGFELSDTFCFPANTNVVQPGIKTLFPYEQDFFDAMVGKGIVAKNVLEDDEAGRILFIRYLFCEMTSSGFPPTMEFVDEELSKFHRIKRNI